MIRNERTRWLLLCGILIAIILYLRTCRTKDCPEYTQTIVRDTIYITIRDTSIWKVPVPKTIVRYDTIIDTEHLYIVEPADTTILQYMAMRNDYFSKRYYEDTTYNDYGYIITQDSVYNNRLQKHRVLTSLHIPTINETITNYAKPKVQIYAGIGAYGNRQTFLSGFEGTLTLKTRNDQLYEVGILTGEGGLYYKGAVKFKLKF